MENGEVEMNECMENEIMQQDLEMLVDSDLPITALEGKSVLVTGATGLIGSQMVYLLACYNRMRNLQIHIIGIFGFCRLHYTRSQCNQFKIFCV